MATRLLLIRHGDSLHKTEGVTGGQLSCKGLTQVGRTQATRLRDRFVYEGGFTTPPNIYSSTLPRAIETAQIITEAFAEDNRSVRQDCDLCTWHIPAAWDGMTWTDVKEQFSQAGGGVFRPFEQGAESWAELVSRVGRGLYTIAQRHQGETTLVVTHKEAVQASLIVLGALPLMLPFDSEVANTSITEWQTDGDTTTFPSPRWTLARLNDAAHLTASLSAVH